MGFSAARVGVVALAATVMVMTSGCEVVTTTTTVAVNCAGNISLDNGARTQQVTATATPSEVTGGGTLWIDLAIQPLPKPLFSDRYGAELRFTLHSLTVKDVTFPDAGPGTWTGSWRIDGQYTYITIGGRGLPEANVVPPHLHIETVVDPHLGAPSNIVFPAWDVAHIGYSFDLSPAEMWCVPGSLPGGLVSVPVV